MSTLLAVHVSPGLSLYKMNTCSYRCLLDIKYFNIFESSLPHDAMHEFLERIEPLDVKLLLS